MGRALSVYLDALRFGAALLVLFGHVQLQVEASGPLGLLGSLAHQGVVVFFVVSGFLVGGKLLNNPITPPFLTRYAVDRASRIYTVTIPAILLGLLVVAWLDATYGHHYSLRGLNNCRATAGDFFASLAFLHEGLWPGPCGNGPFWSLIYEVYYYVTGALIMGAVAATGRLRLFCAIGAVAALAYGLFEPTGMLPYGAVWLLGAATAQKGFGLRQKVVWAVAVVGVLIMPLLVLKPEVKWDSLGAFLVAGSILAASRVNYCPPRIARLLAWGAGFSFSLYMTHAPVLSLLRTTTGYQPDGSPLVFAGLCLACLIFAYGFYLVFERQTGAIRAMLIGRNAKTAQLSSSKAE
jgi:peptidoglycan/LPS O-acetylase OafA/YrhL